MATNRELNIQVIQIKTEELEQDLRKRYQYYWDTTFERGNKSQFAELRDRLRKEYEKLLFMEDLIHNTPKSQKELKKEYRRLYGMYLEYIRLIVYRICELVNVTSVHIVQNGKTIAEIESPYPIEGADPDSFTHV